ncbi:MAG: RNA polymerase sigma factor SigJ [Acidimicrobiales bacterium]
MTDPLVDPETTFATERPRLTGLAYRMLGSVVDAEDILQEVWIRWHGADAESLERPSAWLTTVTTRLALDRLRSLRRHREDYLGPWLPEPIVAGPGPEAAAELADSLTLGFLVLLDQLSPLDRAVFILADVFGVPYKEIAVIVTKSPAACRQMASRARRRVHQAPLPTAPNADRHLVDELVAAIAAGDVETVLAYLAPNVICTADGGALRRAARHPVVGAPRVAHFLINLARRFSGQLAVTPASINGDAGFILKIDGAIDQVMAFEISGSQVAAIRIIRNPDKLQLIGKLHDLC